MFNQLPRHEQGWYSGVIAPRILNLDGGEESASRPGSFTPREKRARYPMTWRLSGPNRWSGPSGKKKGHLLWQDPYEVSRFHCCLGCSLVSIPTELSWLNINNNKYCLLIYLSVSYFLGFLLCVSFVLFYFTILHGP